MFVLSAWAQPATVLAGTTVEGSSVASDRLVGVGSVSHSGRGHYRCGRCSGLCSLGRRGFSQPLLLRTRKLRALFWPLFAWSSWAQPATVEAGAKSEIVALASIRSICVVSTSHCCGRHDRRGRCFGLCSLGRRGLIQPLWWRIRQVKALLWPLFDSSAWAQEATVVAGTTGEGAALASVLSVGISSGSHFCGGTTGEGAVLASVRSEGIVSSIHCGDGYDR
jgi:hypothetical protein